MGAVKAITAANIAMNGKGIRRVVSFDRVVRVMKRTGDDMSKIYKETSLGGLAQDFIDHPSKRFNK